MNDDFPEEQLEVTEFNTPPPDKARGWQIATIVFVLTTAGFAALWYQSQKELSSYNWQKNFVTEWNANGTLFITRWRSTTNAASIHNDENFDGNFERWSTFDFQGNKTFEAFDYNEDGFQEHSVSYSPKGDTLTITYDEDEDGFNERVIEVGGGMRVHYLDVTNDGTFDSVYVTKAALERRLSWKELVQFLLPTNNATDTIHQ